MTLLRWKVAIEERLDKKVGRGLKDLNLIPKSYYQNKKKKEKKKLIFLSVFLLSFVVIVSVAYPVYTKMRLNAQLNDLKKKVEDTARYKINQDKLAEANLKFFNLKTESEKLSKYSFSSINVIERIAQFMPKKLFITDFSIGNRNDGNVNIALKGNCASEEDIVTFLYSLRKDKFFDNIYISTIQKIGETSNSTPSTPAPMSTPVKNKKITANSKAKNIAIPATQNALSAQVVETTVSYSFDMSLNYTVR
ncbi:Fimbrial assembly family protein [Pseudobacteroides cellulosolvens ATCC 35603 = DSM 2933]|uniref:Fimbrial assembly family protein n=1 Tax=Pseudobacteroides cellulosolvens ATCC 35603 = DSM 2933 TaxID=398512 RepID=A0A0L6JLM4_9FIRM|nr:Fimbrial assembly family protein [Pseudobacteroides cellulosolvens ATCC 35603 = DSM 2933]